MVVVCLAAHAIHRLTVFTQNDIYVASGAQCLQGPIHGSQTDAVSAFLEILMYLLGGTKVVKFCECF
jgi:hypothetical protein